ncbi:MAG TPA: hypothetical protein VEY50_00850 [Lysobacter sp.]|nr:hypothetical protein [Lysobacter sp.]
MKLGLCIVLLATVGLAACASTSETSSAAPKRTPSIMDPDEAYMARVQEVARRRGIQVQWVHPPHKTAAQVARETQAQQQ